MISLPSSKTNITSIPLNQRETSIDSSALCNFKFRLLSLPSPSPSSSHRQLKDSFSRISSYTSEAINHQESSIKSPTTEDMATNGKKAPVQRYAVVTGANKGIGFETARQLATKGVTVILTARDESRGLQAISKLHDMGLSNVVFHQLDVLDPVSIESLALFIKEKYGWLDILVNNAGHSGVIVDEDALRAMNIDPVLWLSGKVVDKIQDVIKFTYESAELCLKTNYYGCKHVAEALLPLLQVSPSGARIVNVSSLRSELRRIPSEQIRNELGDLDNLTEEKIDAVLKRFLHDLKENKLEENGWTTMLPAYSISKQTLNAYTRLLAKKYPNDMYINCVHPGYVNTDINWHTGPLTVEEGARGPVMLALLPDGGPTGRYFDQTEVAEF